MSFYSLILVLCKNEAAHFKEKRKKYIKFIDLKKIDKTTISSSISIKVTIQKYH